jgi:hypothetical protein
VKADEFRKLTAGVWLSRITGFCDDLVLALLMCAVITTGFYIGAFDGTLSILFGPIVASIILGTAAAIISARRFATKIALVMERLSALFLDADQASEEIRTFATRRSFDSLSGVAIAIGVGIWLFSITAKRVPILSQAYLAFVSAIGGMIFGLGLTKYIWNYRLIWKIGKNPVSIWKTHELRHAAAYNYSLTLVGMVPVMITLYFWAATRSAELLWIAGTQAVVVLWLFVRTEGVILQMVRASKEEILGVVSSLESDLWNEIESSGRGKALVSDLANLESLRRSLLTYNTFGVVAWGDFVARVVVPLLAGSIPIIYELMQGR